MTALAEIDTFGLILPATWTGLPLEPAAFDVFSAELREQWRAEPDWDRNSERKAELLLQRVRSELTRRGATFAGIFCDAGVPDDKPLTEENLEPMMAVCTFAAYSQADLDTELALTLPVLFAAFATKSAAEGKHGTMTNLQPPEVDTLPVGKVVRLRRLYRPKGFGTQTEPFYAESFITPLGDDGLAAGVLQFATVNIDIAHEFSDLFEAIAKTMTLFTPDQPTDFSRTQSTPNHPGTEGS
jgi:hypothetical protein